MVFLNLLLGGKEIHRDLGQEQQSRLELTARTRRDEEGSTPWPRRIEIFPSVSQDFNSTAINSNGVSLRFSGECSILSK